MEFKNEKQMSVVDADGNEHLMEILFTYEHEERGTKYVFFYEASSPEEVICMRYTDDGELEEIEDDEEYAEVEEVFNAFQEDPKIQDLKEDK